MDLNSAVTYFIKGLIIGFSLSLPVGPIALLCIRRTLTKGKLSGIFSGLGAATADTFYGLVAGFGVSLVSNFLVKHSFALQIFGGVFLCYMGVRIFHTVPTVRQEYYDEIGFAKDYLSSMVLTLTNPMTVFAFAAVFAAAGVGQSDGTLFNTLFLILGVGLGSAIWWLFLTMLMSLFHGKIHQSGLRMINRISGTIIGLFGIAVLINVLFHKIPMIMNH